MTYEDFDREVEEIRAENNVLLDDFEKWLTSSGLKDKTIKKHIGNVEFYVNDYLLYDDCTRAKEGASALNGFFDWFFPKKAMWSSQAATKETTASLKKFYKYLTETKIIHAVDYHFMLSEIKENMPSWLENYDDDMKW